MYRSPRKVDRALARPIGDSRALPPCCCRQNFRWLLLVMVALPAVLVSMNAGRLLLVMLALPAVLLLKNSRRCW